MTTSKSDYTTFIVNTVYVNDEAAYVSISFNEALAYYKAEKAKGNKTEIKAYATNKQFMESNSDYIDYSPNKYED